MVRRRAHAEVSPWLAVPAGLAAGAVLGVIAGRDLAGSVRSMAGSRGGFRAAFGFLRRIGILAAGLFGSLLIGPAAWAGMAAGYLGGFGATVWREARVHVG